MLSHESLMSYYKVNSSLLFRKRLAFEQLITLTEIEEMLPYERDIYLIQILQKLEKHNAENG